MATFVVTLYKLLLGEQDATTGWYQKAYSEHTITIADFPRGYAGRLTAIGPFMQYSRVGFTAYDVREGDVFKNEAGEYYEILSVEPWRIGNEFVYNTLGCEPKPGFALSKTFWGFEDTEHGALGGGFDENFERGYVVLE